MTMCILLGKIMDLVKGSQKGFPVVCITGTFLMKLYSFFQEKIVEVS